MGLSNEKKKERKKNLLGQGEFRQGSRGTSSIGPFCRELGDLYVLLKQEASRLLLPCPPFSILLLGSSFQKPDLYSITHGPQMLLFSFASSMGGRESSQHRDTSTPEQAGLPQYFREGICPSPSTWRIQSCSGLRPWWERDEKAPSQWGASPHSGLYF